MLSVQDLVVRYPIRKGPFQRLVSRLHAAERISFDLYEGETLAIVGESGCGKSTVGKAIMGLVPKQAGRVFLEGQDIAALSNRGMRAARRGIQMVFQDPYASLNPRMTVEEIIAEPLRIHGLGSRQEHQEQIRDLLKKVGLQPEHARRYPHQFSGGQRQRICIARALVLRPKVIIADEPVSALDVSVQAQVMALLKEIQEEFGIAIVFISHDMAVVERISDRVAVMYLGEIVETGPTAAILSDSRHAYTRQLLDAVPINHPALRRERALGLREIQTPIRPLDYVPPALDFDEVAPGHFVRQSP